MARNAPAPTATPTAAAFAAPSPPFLRRSSEAIDAVRDALEVDGNARLRLQQHHIIGGAHQRRRESLTVAQANAQFRSHVDLRHELSPDAGGGLILSQHRMRQQQRRDHQHDQRNVSWSPQKSTPTPTRAERRRQAVTRKAEAGVGADEGLLGDVELEAADRLRLHAVRDVREDRWCGQRHWRDAP